MSEALYQALLAALRSYQADEAYVAGTASNDERAAAWEVFRSAVEPLTTDEQCEMLRFRRTLAANTPRD